MSDPDSSTAPVPDPGDAARAADTLLVAQERYRALLHSIDQGFCVVEVLFGENGKPRDYRFLDVNPSYEAHMGIVKAPGRTMLEVAPHHEEQWLETYGRVAMSGEPARFENQAAQLRHDVFAFRIGAPEARHVAILVKDISETRQSAEALQRAHEQLEARVEERTRELAAANALLREQILERRRAQDARRDLLRQLVNAQEGERRRISRELHDTLGQQVSALGLKLSMLKNDPKLDAGVRAELEKLEQLVRATDSDLDYLVWELRPTALDDLGLIDALREHVQSWSTHFCVPAQLDAHGVGDARVDPEIETVLYRIAQEALNNVAKHAHAKRVELLLQRTASNIELTVTDDGDGFEAMPHAATRSRGLGLQSMRERAALVGGLVRVEARPRAGTTVFVRIPLPDANA